jgi:hypothetical protein
MGIPQHVSIPDVSYSANTNIPRFSLRFILAICQPSMCSIFSRYPHTPNTCDQLTSWATSLGPSFSCSELSSLQSSPSRQATSRRALSQASVADVKLSTYHYVKFSLDERIHEDGWHHAGYECPIPFLPLRYLDSKTFRERYVRSRLLAFIADNVIDSARLSAQESFSIKTLECGRGTLTGY